MKLPKLLVIGHGRHGKDTACEILKKEFNFVFQSSSEFCAKKFIYAELKDKYGYNNFKECYDDRHTHRTEWYELIHNYCKEDHARLGREIFAVNDIYCGLRNKSEFHAMKNTAVFDFSIWIDRSDYLPLEPKTSMNLEMWMADFVIDNNHSVEHFQKNVKELGKYLINKINY